MVTELHTERLDTVVDALRHSGASTVLDLGCGQGELMVLLAAETQFTRIVGIDSSSAALQKARDRLMLEGFDSGTGRLSLFQGSFTHVMEELTGFDAVALVETIEHVPPGKLSSVERAVFSGYRPQTVLITTPNSEYNVLHGMREGDFRHRDHQFEWPRDKFRHWANGVAQRHNYLVRFEDIGIVDARRGSSTQMAIFTRNNSSRS